MRTFPARSSRLFTAALTALTLSTFWGLEDAKALSIQGGTFTLGYDEVSFASLGLTDINSFDQSTSNSLTAAQIQTEAGTYLLWTGIDYGVNPTTALVDPNGRDLQETTFTYNSANLTGSASGQIGIGGTSRWDVNPLLGGGVFVLGDFSLQYDASRAGGVYSGWYLTNNFSFPAIAFDLANVTTNVLGDGGFTLSGDLYVKTGSPLTLFGFSGDTDYGNFSLNAVTAVPEPSTWALISLGAGVAIWMRRRHQRRA